MSALNGQAGLVTGGGRGVGRAIALSLARGGMAVTVTARSGDELAETVRMVTAAGGRATAVIADVTRREDMAAAVATAQERFGALDLCVANAGVFAAAGRLWEQDPDLWWRDVEVNLRGPLLTLHAALPGMVERGRGRVVTVASGIGTAPNPWASAYASSKAAVFRLTDSLAGELVGTGVSAFAISPGLVRTAMTDWPAEFLRWYPDWAEIPAEEYVDPARAGELVAALAAGGYDALSGRYLHVTHDLDEVLRQTAGPASERFGTLRLIPFPEASTAG